MPFDPTALLRHRDFVRAVAGKLLQDPHLVDDVEQETWATALDRPPRSRNALAAWLGKVAQRLAFRALRSRERRGRRERASSPPRPLTSPDEMARNLETQQRVVAAVLKLDPLYREVILLRFYEGLKPREAAARLQVPVNTVRTRTRRAIELLRADLERDRRAWFLGLLPLLEPRRAVLGALLMKAKLAAVAAILVLSAAVVWQLAPRAETPRAEAQRPIVEPLPEAPRVCRLTGRVTDGAGEPIDGARVEISDVAAVTDALGAFALEREREGSDVLAASSGALRAQQVVELKLGEQSAGTLVLSESVTVTGIVVDTGGEGVPGAVVEAWPAVAETLTDNPLSWTRPQPPIAGSTLSGEDGAFRLPLPRGASMVLRAQKGDAMTRDEVGYDLREDTGLVVLRLRAKGAIRGRVVDLAGAPVMGASVQLVPPSRWRQVPYPDVRSVRGIRATTGADGTFALAAPPELYGLVVTHPAFVPFHADRVLAPRDGWTIRLSPGRALEGVVEADGRPAPDVLVRVVGTDGHAAPQETRTGADGKFVLSHASLDRPFHVLADGGRLGTALLRDVVWRGEPVRVKLDPVADVLGRVVLKDGTPVGGVRLDAFEFMLQNGTVLLLRGYREATSGPDGRFRMEGASRNHAIQIRYGEPWLLSGENAIRADGSEVVLTVKPLRLVTVHVTDASGAPVPGAAILDRVFTDAEGTCRVLIPPWITDLVATKPGLRGRAEIPGEGDVVSIVLSPSPVLKGIVRDASGAPLADVRVQSTDSTPGRTSWGYRTAFTDASGAFALYLAGNETEESVTFERAGFTPLVTGMRADGEVKEVVLQRGRNVRGRVVDEKGNPLAGVAVAVQGLTGSVLWTPEDGRFVLEDLEPSGSTIVSFSAAGYARRQVLLTDERAQEERVFVLAPELFIEGQVLKADGTPAHRVLVCATAETPPDPGMSAETDSEGRFRIPGLSSGRYTLDVSPSLYTGRKDLEDAEWDSVKGVTAGTAGLVLRSKPPQVLAGIVVDENDRGLRGARVNVYDAGGTFLTGEWADEQGRFRIPVRTGKYELRVNLAGMAFRKMRGVASGREDLLLRFEPGQEVTGQIGSPDGYAAGSGSVEVSAGDFHGYAEIDRSGGFSIRGLPRGACELSAMGAARGGGTALYGTARVEAGATGVQIELKKVDLR